MGLTSAHYLYLSGTPFRAITNGEFNEDQIFNWTYIDEQASRASRAMRTRVRSADRAIKGDEETFDAACRLTFCRRSCPRARANPKMPPSGNYGHRIANR